MKKIPFKKIILVTGVAALFILVTIYIIISAQGKQFLPTGEIINTGIIRINSKPQDVSVFINDKKVNKTENRVEGIEPGEVKIKLTREGYLDWEKTVTIEAGLVTDLYAQLFPQELNFEQITSTNVDRIFFGMNTDFIFYTITNTDIKTNNSSENGIWKLKLTRNLFNIGTNEPTEIFTFDKATLEAIKDGNYNIIVSPDNNKVALIMPSINKILIVNANDQNATFDLTEKLGFFPKKISWFRGSDSLIIDNDKVLFEYEINSNQMRIVSINSNTDELNYAVNSNFILFIRKDTNTIYQYQNGVAEPFKYIVPNPKKEVIESIYTNYFSPNFIVKIGNVFKYIDPVKNFISDIDSNITIQSISQSAKNIIYLKDNKYFTFNLEDTSDLKSYKATKSEIKLDSSKVDTIYFSAANNNILALISEESQKTLYFMDFDGQNPKVVVSNKAISGEVSQTANNGSSLYLLLEDDINELTKATAAKKNIYKISLEN